MSKRGAHAPKYLLTADKGFGTFEEVYGPENLADAEDWTMANDDNPGVRLITAAPEVPGVLQALPELNKRGVAYSIGHRQVSHVSCRPTVNLAFLSTASPTLK